MEFILELLLNQENIRKVVMVGFNKQLVIFQTIYTEIVQFKLIGIEFAIGTMIVF